MLHKCVPRSFGVDEWIVVQRMPHFVIMKYRVLNKCWVLKNKRFPKF